MTRSRSLGIWMATALVVGNMIGSGTYLLPASLAPYGMASLLGWSVSLAGALALAAVYAWLSRQLPVTGGPYAYARAAFGNFAGFVTAWCYWISVWCGNAAIAVAFAGYLGGLVPAIGASSTAGAITALAGVWLCTLFNIVGVRAAGWVQMITTILKLLPLIALAFIGVWHLDSATFATFNPSREPLLDVTTVTVALTLWAFLGMESATVPAEDVEDADRTIPRATIAGTFVAAIATIVACTVVVGIVPADTLIHSTLPLADAARLLWGNAVGIAVTIAAVIACFGALNGWTLIMGQVPFAAARDGLFPGFLARLNSRGTPGLSLVFSSGITTVLVIANFQGSLIALFTWSILLSTAAVLVPYIISMAAALGIGRIPGPHIGIRAVAAFAVAYGIYALVGTGIEALAWGAGLLLAGLPVHFLLQHANNSPGE